MSSNNGIALKFDRRLGKSTVKEPRDFRINTILEHNLVASEIGEIYQDVMKQI